MRKKIFFVSRMLFISLLLLCSCGNSTEETAREGDESVMLSNILFPDMKMSEEDKNLLQSVDEILSNAVIKLDISSWTVITENTSGKTLNIQFIIQGYDENNCIVDNYNMYVDNWETGIPVSIEFSAISSEAVRWEIGAVFEAGDHYIRSYCYPLRESQDSKPLSLEFDGELPYRFTVGDSVFLLTNIKLVNTGTYASSSFEPFFNLELSLTKESGFTETQENINYRILTREDGVVIYSSSATLYGIVEGEKLKVQDSYLLFLPDTEDYILQIIEE